MEYKKFTRDSFNIHFVKTKRFKAVNVDIFFTKEFKKEDISYANLLCNMLTYSSKKYNTKNKYAIKLEELYSMKCSSTFGIHGNTEYINVSIEFINPKYTEKSMYMESLIFLKEILFNPHIEKDKFNDKIFDINKSSLKTQLDTLKANPKLFSDLKYRSFMYAGTPTANCILGNDKDYNKINSKKLYNFYKTLFKDFKIDIVVVGDINTEDEETVFSSIDNMFKNVNPKKLKKLNLYIKHKYNSKVKQVIEKDKFNQSQLYMGYRFKDINEFELKYVLTLYNIILGNIGTSVLFESLRTKNYLCYSIGSSKNTYNTSVTINSGINKVNFNKAVELIEKSIKDMTDEKKIQSKLNVALKTMNTILNDYYDDVYSIIDYYYNLEFEFLDSIEERREKLMNITVDDIVNLGKKAYLTTIYMLEGENE